MFALKTSYFEEVSHKQKLSENISLINTNKSLPKKCNDNGTETFCKKLKQKWTSLLHFTLLLLMLSRTRQLKKKAAKVNTFTNMIYFMLFFVRGIKLRLPESEQPLFYGGDP